MGHPIYFIFVLVWGFWVADRTNLLQVEPNPRDGRAPSSKMSNEYISGISYPIHFHETESSFVGIWESIMHEE